MTNWLRCLATQISEIRKMLMGSNLSGSIVIFLVFTICKSGIIGRTRYDAAQSTLRACPAMHAYCALLSARNREEEEDRPV